MTEQVPAYLQPQYFLPIFAVAWFGTTGLLAYLGGWVSLTKTYKLPHVSEHYSSRAAIEGIAQQCLLSSEAVHRSLMRLRGTHAVDLGRVHPASRQWFMLPSLNRVTPGGGPIRWTSLSM